jgi:hypothetical protein
MSTRSALIELAASLSATRKALAEVRQSGGDFPVIGGAETHATKRDGPVTVVVVDLLQDACDDLDGWLLSATTAVDKARQVSKQRRTLLVVDQLAEASHAVNRAVATYVTGLGGVDSITRLRELAVDQGGAWKEWSWTVLEVLGPVWTRLMMVRADLDGCWLEWIEHLLRDPIEVRTSLRSDGHQGKEVLTGGQ